MHNKRAISPIISIILLIVITISIASTSYIFLNNLLFKQLSKSKENIEEIYDISLLQITNIYWYDYRDGLVLELRFDEGEGNIVKDYSGNGNDGTSKTMYLGGKKEGIWMKTMKFGCSQPTDFISLKRCILNAQDNVNGYGETIIPNITESYKNVNLFGSQYNISYIYEAWFYVDKNNRGSWNFKVHIDGFAKAIVIDKKIVWENYNNDWVWYTFTVNLDEGWHYIIVYDLEPCCDGGNGIYVKRPTDLDYIPFGRPYINVKIYHYVDGTIGKALEFDGVDDYVDLPNRANGNYPRTVIAWIKEVPMTGRYDIINARGTFFNIQGSKVCFWISGANTQYLCSNDPIISGEWNFAVGMYENNMERVYVNGKFSGELNVGNPNSGTYNDVVGVCSYCNFQSWFRGLIDELRIYNKALDEETIKNLFYRIHLIVYNPSDKPIELNNTYFSIGDCIFKLIYNETFITNKDRSIIYPNEQIVLKVTNIKCHLDRYKEYDICLISRGNKICDKVKVR